MASPTIVIFGASGDLTQRKLVPALFHLWLDGLLPPDFALVGFARRPKSDGQFRQELQAAVAEYGRTQPLDCAAWARFAERVRYHTADFDNPAGYAALRALLDRLDAERGVPAGAGSRLFYLATPPDAYPRIVTQLGGAGLNDEESDGWTRIIIEKPFGHDAPSAEALNAHVLGVFSERQVYRIDHYLGKETVQNILAFRLGNSIFEPLWNRRYVEQVQITVAEKIGVEGRGGYYDNSGAIRDIIQNHALQVLALIAMEPPAAFTATAVRNEKVKVLQSLRPFAPDALERDVVRGQYVGYQAERGVAPGSRTETFVALKLHVDNWRWASVPFYLRTGKAMPQRLTQVVVQFRQPPLTLFAHHAHAGHVGPVGVSEPNALILGIQPHERVALHIGMKPPGAAMELAPVTLDFSYSTGFGATMPEAYERLILDAIHGDATLFIRRDEVEAAWAYIDPLLHSWATSNAAPAPYPQGSWGPAAADLLLGRDGSSWYQTEKSASQM